jgi:hypothetical protein
MSRVIILCTSIVLVLFTLVHITVWYAKRPVEYIARVIEDPALIRDYEELHVEYEQLQAMVRDLMQERNEWEQKLLDSERSGR